MRTYHMICKTGKQGQPVQRICTIGSDSGANPIKVAQSHGLAIGRGYKAFLMSPEVYALDLAGKPAIAFFL